MPEDARADAVTGAVTGVTRAMPEDARAAAEPPPGMDPRDPGERSRSPRRFPTYHRDRERHKHEGRMEVRLSAMHQEIDDL